MVDSVSLLVGLVGSSEYPGQQFDSSVLGDILGDPATLMALASVIVPNFTAGGMQFKPREALRAGAQLYGDTANRQALQKELVKIAGQSTFSPPQNVPPEQAMYVPKETTLGDRAEYAAKFEPPTEAQVMRQLSPKAFKAAYGTKSAMGDFSTIMGRMREGEMGKAGREKERLLAEAWSKFEANPSDESLQKTIIGLSKEPGAAAKEFGNVKNVADYLGKSIPDHMKPYAPFLARYMPQYGAQLAESSRVAQQQYETAIKTFPDLNPTIKSLLLSNKASAIPLSQEVFTSTVMNEATSSRLHLIAQGNDKIRNLITNNSSLDPNEATALFATLPPDVVPQLQSIQRHAIDSKIKNDFNAAQLKQQDEANKARLEEAKFYHLEQKWDRQDRQKFTEFVKRIEIQNVQTARADAGIRNSIMNQERLSKDMERVQSEVPITPDEQKTAEGRRAYLQRLRQVRPEYAEMEAQKIAVRDLGIRHEWERQMAIDPTGDLTKSMDQMQITDEISRLAKQVTSALPKLTDKSKAGFIEKIDGYIDRLNKTRLMYRGTVPGWDQEVYKPKVDVLKDMRKRLMNSLTVVTPPGDFLDWFVPEQKEPDPSISPRPIFAPQ